MQLIQSGQRVFFAEGQPIQIYNKHEERVLVYPHGMEALYVEKGLKPSQIARHCLQKGLVDSSSIDNRFQISEGEVEFDVRQMRRPGILIRYSDAVSHHDMKERRAMGMDEGMDKVAEYFQIGAHLWNTAILHMVLDPALFYSFMSRSYMPLHRKPLFSKPGGTKLEKEVKRLFREFLTREEGLVFEALTDGGLVQYSPDLVLLDNALRGGIETGLSHYKQTNGAVVKYIIERLQESRREVRRQFERKIRHYRRFVDIFRPFVESARGERGIEKLNFAMEACDLAEDIKESLRKLDEGE
jgi:hypothetical protein